MTRVELLETCAREAVRRSRSREEEIALIKTVWQREDPAALTGAEADTAAEILYQAALRKVRRRVRP